MKIILDVMCVNCENFFLYSHPNCFSFDDGTQSPKYGLCEKCWIEIGKIEGWSEKNKNISKNEKN